MIDRTQMRDLPQFDGERRPEKKRIRITKTRLMPQKNHLGETIAMHMRTVVVFNGSAEAYKRRFGKVYKRRFGKVYEPGPSGRGKGRELMPRVDTSEYTPQEKTARFMYTCKLCANYKPGQRCMCKMSMGFNDCHTTRKGDNP